MGQKQVKYDCCSEEGEIAKVQRSTIMRKAANFT